MRSNFVFSVSSGALTPSTQFKTVVLSATGRRAKKYVEPAVVHICNPSVQESEVGESGDQPNLSKTQQTWFSQKAKEYDRIVGRQ